MNEKPFAFPKLYTEFAKYYDQLEGQYRDHAKESVWLEQLFENFGCRQIVDVSCGTGTHLALLAKNGASTQKDLFGMDASREMVQIALGKLRASGNAANVPIAQADFLHPPFHQNLFDAVLCMYWSLAGLDEQLVQLLFSAANSILKKGGIFVFDTENAEGIKENLLNAPFIDSHFPTDNGEEGGLLFRANYSRKIARDIVDWHAYYLFESHGASELQNDKMLLRFYSRKQLEGFLSLSGFKVLEVLSGPFQQYVENSPSLYFVAQKA